MNADTFNILLLIARPGAGKSEIIDYLRQYPSDERKKRFRIGEFEEIDDFPMLWRWSEEDHILSEMGCPRLYTDENGYFISQYFWNLLIRLICLDYRKKIADNPQYHETYTCILEFSRGSEHGGYESSFHNLSPEILAKLAILSIEYLPQAVPHILL